MLRVVKESVSGCREGLISEKRQNYLKKVKRKFYPFPVVYRQDVYRSADGDQFHRKAENAKDVINAGADILVVGSEIFKSKNPIETINEMYNL